MKLLRFYLSKGKHPRPVNSLLPPSFYKQVHANMPIVCVDLVVKFKKEFLMVKRLNEPCKGQWFVPGGRVLKDETLAIAARRKLLQETGLRTAKLSFLTAAEHFNVRGYFPKGVSHMITFVFLAEVKKKSGVRVDIQSSQARWFSQIPKTLHPYPKSALKLAGFSSSK